MTERIYNLVPKEVPVRSKEAMYRSKYDPETPLVGSTIGTFGSRRIDGAGCVEKKANSLFAPQSFEKPDPKKFLRKHDGEKRTEKAAEEEQPARKKRDYELSRPPPEVVIPPRPRAPAQSERPIHGIHTEKNFIVGNAIETILQVPGEPRAEEPNYLEKPGYGKVPKYLAKVRKEVEEENKVIDEYIREHMGEKEEEEEDTLNELDNTERQQLIEKLKAKWEKTNRKYQRMTHVVKLENFQKRRKEKLETELSELEKQIAILSRTGTIYVQD